MQSLVFITLAFVSAFSMQAWAGEYIHQHKSDDVQVLQAWYGKRVSAPNMYPNGETTIDMRNCVKLGEDPNWNSDTSKARASRDCTQELARLEGSPMVQPFILDSVFSYPGSEELHSQYLYCSLVEIRTITKSSVLSAPSFRGIGFYMGRTETFVPKEKLHAIGKTNLKSTGEEVIVHRFIAAGACWAGSMTSSLRQVNDFKPYARFDVEQGGVNHIYKNWENVGANHALSPGGTKSFDRQNDLLRK